MILSEIIAWPSLLLTQVVTIAGRALILAAGAGLGLTVFRVKSTGLRLFTWTAVLYAIIAVSLMRWLPAVPVPMPMFLQETGAKPYPVSATLVQSSSQKRLAAVPQNKRVRLTEATSGNTPSAPATVAARTWDAISSPVVISWKAVASTIYLAMAGLLLVRIIAGLAFTQRLVRASHGIHNARVSEILQFRTTDWRHATVPRIAESEVISVPVTVGVVRASILLPAGWREWDDAKLDTVIAHEMSHVIRHDALTQFVSLLHRAVFWFSPLAWWLDRHLRDLAEQASDEAALSAGANRNEYAKTLLGFFETLQAAPQRVWWQGVAMAEAGRAEQRVERILAWRGAVTMNLKRSVAVAIIAFLVPVVYLAASVRPARAHDAALVAAGRQEPAPPPEPNAVPAKPPAGEATVVPPNAGSKAAPVVPAAPQVPDATPVVEAEPHEHDYSYSYGYDDEERFVIVSGKMDAFTISGSSQDARHAEKLKKRIPGDFIWFQRDEKSYIIRDQATVERARKLWEPQRELGAKQEELGKQQEALGKQQEELGARMERIQVKVPDMTAELDKLRAELKSLSAGATAEQVGRIQSEIGELQSKIGEVQSSAGEQQSKIGEEMGALGEKQGKLGEQQGELGRRQGQLAKQATRQMKELLDEAIKKGTAQPEAQTSDEGTL